MLVCTYFSILRTFVLSERCRVPRLLIFLPGLGQTKYSGSPWPGWVWVGPLTFIFPLRAGEELELDIITGWLAGCITHIKLSSSG